MSTLKSLLMIYFFAQKHPLFLRNNFALWQSRVSRFHLFLFLERESLLTGCIKLGFLKLYL